MTDKKIPIGKKIELLKAENEELKAEIATLNNASSVQSENNEQIELLEEINEDLKKENANLLNMIETLKNENNNLSEKLKNKTGHNKNSKNPDEFLLDSDNLKEFNDYVFAIGKELVGINSKEEKQAIVDEILKKRGIK